MVIAYNSSMSLIDSFISSNRCQRRIVHWLVLLAVVLGQLTVSASMALAQPSHHTETKVPVCTSTGVIYVSWSGSGANAVQTGDPDDAAGTHAGTCVWCTISPNQLRFGLHTESLGVAKPSCLRLSGPDTASRLSAFAGNPDAPPRAPPFV